MPKLKPETQAARRDQILDAAETCFARDGFHQTTIQDVIAESGLSAGCIYGHFQSKEELIETISERRHKIDATLFSASSRAGDPIATVRATAAAFLGNLEGPQGMRARRVGVQLWSEALNNEAIKSQVRAGVKQALIELEAPLRQAQERGELDKTLDTQALAGVLVALFQGIVLHRVWEETVQAEPLLRVFDALLYGLRPRAFPAP